MKRDVNFRFVKRILSGQQGSRHRWLVLMTLCAALALTGAAVQWSSAQVITQQPGVAYAADETEAAKVLGRPVPQPRDVPAGFTRTQFTLEAPSADPALATPRKVRQTFAIQGQDLALLTVLRTTLGQSLDKVDVVQLGGRSVTVSTKTLKDGTTVVSYRWQLGELAAFFDINLVRGIDRSVADRLVASVE